MQSLYQSRARVEKKLERRVVGTRCRAEFEPLAPSNPIPRSSEPTDSKANYEEQAPATWRSSRHDAGGEQAANRPAGIVFAFRAREYLGDPRYESKRLDTFGWGIEMR